MSETKEPENKTARAGRKTITLNVKRTVETGHVRQSFSHGRSKSVVVEKKRSKKPLSMQDAAASVTQEQSPTAKPKRAQPPVKRSAEQTPAAEKSRTVLRQLSTNEMDARAPAIAVKRLGHSLIKEIRWISTPTYPGIGIHADRLARAGGHG
ncbi:MAG: translation initiation factor IF-2 associated domain-containing protein, partial [Alphaproteobacteria bacterium]